MRKLSDMENNIFTPKLVDVILPGCTIETKVSNQESQNDEQIEFKPTNDKSESSEE